MKMKSCIISIDEGEIVDKSLHLFIIKTLLSEMVIEKKFLNKIKEIYKKATANLMLNVEILTAFLLRVRLRYGCLLFPFSFIIILETLAGSGR